MLKNNMNFLYWYFECYIDVLGLLRLINVEIDFLVCLR